MPSEKRPGPEEQGTKTPPNPPKRGASVAPKHVYNQDGTLLPPPPPPANRRAVPVSSTPAGAKRSGQGSAPSPVRQSPQTKQGGQAPLPRKSSSASPGQRAEALPREKAPPPLVAASPSGEKKKPAKSPPPEEDLRLDDEFELEGEWKGIKLRKRRLANNGCLRGAMYFAFICIVSVILAVNIWSWADDVLALTKEEGTVTLLIPEDYDYKSIAKELQDLGVIKHAWLFEMYCDMSDASQYIDPGERELNTKHDYRALVRDMRYVEERVQIRITFPEGVTLDGIIGLLIENGVSSREALLNSAETVDFGYSFLADLPAAENRLEGYLFPDTYFFYKDESSRSILSKFLAAFNQKLSKNMRERVEELPYSLHEILTIASLIQAEAANVGEMKNIASVIYNRLENRNFPYLEIDASLIYVMEGRREITQEDKDMINPYNLYTAEGLPPGPICSPSINAIRAALYPAKTSYYYYALTDKGVHQFSATLAEHNQVKRNNPGVYGG